MASSPPLRARSKPFPFAALKIHHPISMTVAFSRLKIPSNSLTSFSNSNSTREKNSPSSPSCASSRAKLLFIQQILEIRPVRVEFQVRVHATRPGVGVGGGAELDPEPFFERIYFRATREF